SHAERQGALSPTVTDDQGSHLCLVFYRVDAPGDRSAFPQRPRQAAPGRAEEDPEERVDYDQQRGTAAERDRCMGPRDRMRDQEAGPEQAPAATAGVGTAPAILMLEARQKAADGCDRGQPPVHPGRDTQDHSNNSAEQKWHDATEDDLDRARPVAEQRRRLHQLL